MENYKNIIIKIFNISKKVLFKVLFIIAPENFRDEELLDPKKGFRELWYCHRGSVY